MTLKDGVYRTWDLTGQHSFWVEGREEYVPTGFVRRQLQVAIQAPPTRVIPIGVRARRCLRWASAGRRPVSTPVVTSTVWA